MSKGLDVMRDGDLDCGNGLFEVFPYRLDIEEFKAPEYTKKEPLVESTSSTFLRPRMSSILSDKEVLDIVRYYSFTAKELSIIEKGNADQVLLSTANRYTLEGRDISRFPESIQEAVNELVNGPSTLRISTGGSLI